MEVVGSGGGGGGGCLLFHSNKVSTRYAAVKNVTYSGGMHFYQCVKFS